MNGCDCCFVLQDGLITYDVVEPPVGSTVVMPKYNTEKLPHLNIEAKAVAVNKIHPSLLMPKSPTNPLKWCRMHQDDGLESYQNKDNQQKYIHLYCLFIDLGKIIDSASNQTV